MMFDVSYDVTYNDSKVYLTSALAEYKQWTERTTIP